MRDEELAALPLSTETPPIPDTDVVDLRRRGRAQGSSARSGEVHSLTTRGEGGLLSSVIVGDVDGLPVRDADRADRWQRARARRRDRARHRRAPRLDADGVGDRPARARREPGGATGRAAVQDRRRRSSTSGSRPAATRSRSRSCSTRSCALRAVTTLDGWLAYWERESLRYRVYPGRGAPLDHPMPLSDLALGRAATHADRLVAVIELLVDLARRGVIAAPVAEPAALPAAVEVS